MVRLSEKLLSILLKDNPNFLLWAFFIYSVDIAIMFHKVKSPTWIKETWKTNIVYIYWIIIQNDLEK